MSMGVEKGEGEKLVRRQQMKVSKQGYGDMAAGPKRRTELRMETSLTKGSVVLLIYSEDKTCLS